MTERYRISWVIDIEADSPEEAARQALAIQRNSESTATVFEIHDDCGEFIERVDLNDYDNELEADHG